MTKRQEPSAGSGSTRFKSGQSGNPKGRPRKPNPPPSSPFAILDELLISRFMSRIASANCRSRVPRGRRAIPLALAATRKGRPKRKDKGLPYARILDRKVMIKDGLGARPVGQLKRPSFSTSGRRRWTVTKWRTNDQRRSRPFGGSATRISVPRI
jgi:hypothetical protein